MKARVPQVLLLLIIVKIQAHCTARVHLVLPAIGNKSYILNKT